jgi:predicted transcriptional regulator
MSKQGKSLSNDAIDQIRTVFSACTKENNTKNRTVSVLHPLKRTAQYLGLSLSTVSKYVYGKNNEYATLRKLKTIQLKAKQLATEQSRLSQAVRALKHQLQTTQYNQQKIDAIPSTRANKRKKSSDFHQQQDQIHHSINNISVQLSPKRRKIIALTAEEQDLRD